MKNKKNMTLLLILLIIILLSISGLTYAHFIDTSTSLNNVNAIVTLSPTNIITNNVDKKPKQSPVTNMSQNIVEKIVYPDNFIVDGDNSISMTLSNLNTIEDNVISTNNANISIRLNSGNETEYTKCTYDVIFAWDSDDEYTESDKDLSSEEFEFSVQEGSYLLEKDLSSYSFSGGKAVLFSDSILSLSSTDSTVKDYDFKFNIYNLDVAQDNIGEKEFAGHLEIDNVNCKVGTPLATGDYTGYYADVDDNGTIDGLIFFDYTQGATATSGFLGTGVAVSAVTDNLNVYELKTVGEYNNVVVPVSDDANDRFYVIDLENTKPANEEKTAYWYYSAKTNKISDYSGLTFQTFGYGRSNTNTIKPKWDNSTYGSQNTKDMWSIDFGNKFVLSTNEWKVLATNLKKKAGATDTYSSMTFPSGATFSLSCCYWSSSIQGNTGAWGVAFSDKKAYWYYYDATNFVRLAQTF